jgi:hypothetical protein
MAQNKMAQSMMPTWNAYRANTELVFDTNFCCEIANLTLNTCFKVERAGVYPYRSLVLRWLEGSLIVAVSGILARECTQANFDNMNKELDVIGTNERDKLCRGRTANRQNAIDTLQQCLASGGPESRLFAAEAALAEASNITDDEFAAIFDQGKRYKQMEVLLQTAVTAVLYIKNGAFTQTLLYSSSESFVKDMVNRGVRIKGGATIFEGCTEDDVQVLMDTANFMRIANAIVDKGQKKVRVQEIASRLTECKKYSSGSGKAQHTNRREALFELYSGVSPTRKPKQENAVVEVIPAVMTVNGCEPIKTGRQIMREVEAYAREYDPNASVQVSASAHIYVNNGFAQYVPSPASAAIAASAEGDYLTMECHQLRVNSHIRAQSTDVFVGSRPPQLAMGENNNEYMHLLNASLLFPDPLERTAEVPASQDDYDGYEGSDYDSAFEEQALAAEATAAVSRPSFLGRSESYRSGQAITLSSELPEDEWMEPLKDAECGMMRYGSIGPDNIHNSLNEFGTTMTSASQSFSNADNTRELTLALSAEALFPEGMSSMMIDATDDVLGPQIQSDQLPMIRHMMKRMHSPPLEDDNGSVGKRVRCNMPMNKFVAQIAWDNVNLLSNEQCASLQPFLVNPSQEAVTSWLPVNWVPDPYAFGGASVGQPVSGSSRSAVTINGFPHEDAPDTQPGQAESKMDEPDIDAALQIMEGFNFLYDAHGVKFT